MNLMKRTLSLVLALALLLAPFALFASAIAVAAPDADEIHALAQFGERTQADHCPAPTGHQDDGCSTHCVSGALPQPGALLSWPPRRVSICAPQAGPKFWPFPQSAEAASHTVWSETGARHSSTAFPLNQLFALTNRYRL